MKRVLVVDDEEDIREVIKAVLVRAGHDVKTAVDGRDALRIMARQKFDLVILDLVMPNMEGMETIQHIRQLSSRMPILAITGSGTASSKGRSNVDFLNTATEFGATARLAKPFKGAQLLEAVTALLEPPAQ